MAVGGEAIVFDEVAAALNESIATVVAARVFVFPDHARQIAGVNKAQSRLLPDFDGAQQVARLRVFGIFHIVVFVKCSYMPGNFR